MADETPERLKSVTTIYSFDDLPGLIENGGAKEMSVTGLSGLLADDQHVLDAEVLAVAAALVHASQHLKDGADELFVIHGNIDGGDLDGLTEAMDATNSILDGGTL